MNTNAVMPASDYFNPHYQTRWRDPKTGGRMIWRDGRLWAAAGVDGAYTLVPGVDTYARADELALSLGLLRWGGAHRGGEVITRRHWPDATPVDGRPEIASVPLVVPSASAEGHDERMTAHTARADRWLPLFADGPPEPPPSVEGTTATIPECWACGTIAPRMCHLAKIGWETRAVTLGGSGHRVEAYCPICFAEWGWPDEP